MDEDMEEGRNGNKEDVTMHESPTKLNNSEISQSNCIAPEEARAT